MELKLNIGDPKEKKTLTHVVPAEDAKALFGKKLGDKFKGELVGKVGYEFQITGGSDNAGFPMRNDVVGNARRKLLITKSLGNKQSPKGVRIRKTVAGNTVYDLTSQLNVKVVKHGQEPLFVKAAPAEEKAE